MGCIRSRCLRRSDLCQILQLMFSRIAVRPHRPTLLFLLRQHRCNTFFSRTRSLATRVREESWNFLHAAPAPATRQRGACLQGQRRSRVALRPGSLRGYRCVLVREMPPSLYGVLQAVALRRGPTGFERSDVWPRQLEGRATCCVWRGNRRAKRSRSLARGFVSIECLHLQRDEKETGYRKTAKTQVSSSSPPRRRTREPDDIVDVVVVAVVGTVVKKCVVECCGCGCGSPS